MILFPAQCGEQIVKPIELIWESLVIVQHVLSLFSLPFFPFWITHIGVPSDGKDGKDNSLTRVFNFCKAATYLLTETEGNLLAFNSLCVTNAETKRLS